VSYQKVTLTAKQIKELAVWISLNGDIERVTIEETNESGIGASHDAIYHTGQVERTYSQNITDVGAW
jgi:hypothetical protein